MKESGFSLLETMVALAVFSVAAVGLLSVNTQSVRVSTALEERLLARTVAENVSVDTASAALSQLDLVASGEETQRQLTFEWTRTIEQTQREGLYNVRIEVRRRGGTETLARLGFLAREAGTQ